MKLGELVKKLQRLESVHGADLWVFISDEDDNIGNVLDVSPSLHLRAVTITTDIEVDD